jgi:hypothetical protein
MIKRILLKYLVIPVMVALEVVGVSILYPLWKDSYIKLFLLYVGVYATYDLYRYIKNWCEDNEINDFLKNKIKLK